MKFITTDIGDVSENVLEDVVTSSFNRACMELEEQIERAEWEKECLEKEISELKDRLHELEYNGEAVYESEGRAQEQLEEIKENLDEDQ